MRQLYSNVNSGKLNGLTRPLTSADNEFRGNTLTKEQLDERKEEQAKREARTDWIEDFLDVGSITRVLRYRERDKMPRRRWKTARFSRAHRLRYKTPKSVRRRMNKLGIK